MKKKLISLLLIIAMLSSSTVSYAASVGNHTDLDNEKTSAEIAAHIETVIGKEDLNKSIVDKKQYFYVEGTDCDIIMPKDGEECISMESEGHNINMALPAEVSMAKGYISDNGTIVYKPDESNVSVAIQALSTEQDGLLFDAVRTMVTIENENAPKEYRFEYNLPDGYSLVKDYDFNDAYDEWDCGQIFIIDQNNEIASTIDPAWAIDGNGKSVITDYKIENNTLIQYVEFDGNSAFPIIADPTTHPTKYKSYYTDYATLKNIVAKGYSSCNSLGVQVVVYITSLTKGGVATAPVSGLMLVSELWSYAQFSKVKSKFSEMKSSQWLKSTYTFTWRNGGENSGYVRSASASLDIVAKKGD